MIMRANMANKRQLDMGMHGITVTAVKIVTVSAATGSDEVNDTYN